LRKRYELDQECHRLPECDMKQRDYQATMIKKLHELPEKDPPDAASLAAPGQKATKPDDVKSPTPPGRLRGTSSST
jgi:hypothetical protein